MIDDELTFQKFGYRSTDWGPKSAKRVVAVCDECGKIRDVDKYAHRSICQSCSTRKNGQANKGKVSWRKGETKHLNLTKAFFEENYGKFNIRQLAELAGCDTADVYYRLGQLGIPTKRVLRKHPTETRICVCGCGETLTCRVTSKQKHIVGHYSRSLQHRVTTRVRNEELWLDPEYRKNHSGTNVYNWTGTSSLVERIRSLVECRRWRDEVFKRDDYTCQKCFRRGEHLHADHNPIPFAVLFYEFLQSHAEYSPIEEGETLAELAKTYQPFWDTNNGKTLCEKHHRERQYETIQSIKAFKESRTSAVK